MTRSNLRWNFLAVFLLALLAVQLIHLSRVTSSTWDEPHHLFDGYNIWTRHDYGLNPEVPPLVKLTAALPLLHVRLNVPTDEGRDVPAEAFVDGHAFVFGNGVDRVLFPARMACMVFALALGWMLFAWTREMFGAAAGAFALALFVFDPNFIANGALVTTDVGCACLIFATAYAWYRYTAAPHWGKLLITATAAGLAMVSKFTGALVLPMLLTLAICEAIQQRNGRLFWRRMASFVAVAAGSLAVLWAFYGFRYKARPEGVIHPPLATYLTYLQDPKDAQHLALLARFHVLPEAYIWGLANTKLTSFADTSYFFGHVYRHGSWMYFPACFLIKSTLPLLLMVVLVPVALAFGYWRRGRELIFLTAPVVIYLAVAMSSYMNIGMRHLLPIYPFLYAMTAGAAVVLVRRRWWWGAVFGVLLAWQVATSVRVSPAYMAYANEAWGGPSQVHRYLSDANSDWGQQLKDAKAYLDARHVSQCWFAYFPDTAIDPADYGIHCKKLPTTDSLWWMNFPMDVPPVIEGTVLISDGDLEGIEFGQGRLNPYDSFRGIKPTKLIDGGLWVFDGKFAVPLASALVQAQQAQNLLKAGQTDAALMKAEAAETLAPEAVSVQVAMGDVLKAQGDKADALTHYENALHDAETIEPALQADLVPGLREKIAAIESGDK